MPPDPPDAAGARLVFTFDGRELSARPGQTVAAALITNGVRSWRTTRVHSDRRGLFCGVGVCFDCLVVLNGRANVRACLEPVRSGDIIEPQAETGHDAI